MALCVCNTQSHRRGGEQSDDEWSCCSNPTQIPWAFRVFKQHRTYFVVTKIHQAGEIAKINPSEWRTRRPRCTTPREAKGRNISPPPFCANKTMSVRCYGIGISLARAYRQAVLRIMSFVLIRRILLTSRARWHVLGNSGGLIDRGLKSNVYSNTQKTIRSFSRIVATRLSDTFVFERS